MHAIRSDGRGAWQDCIIIANPTGLPVAIRPKHESIPARILDLALLALLK